MYWQKLGLLYCPPSDPLHPKLATHAANPLAVHLHDDIYRVLYSGRDEHNRSSVGAVDVNIVTRQIVVTHGAPFFEHGPAGSFYADGVSIGCTYRFNGLEYILFMGWQNPVDTHWRGDIGRLRVDQDSNLSLDPAYPFFASDSEDPISLSYPWVFQQDGGDLVMIYGSTTTWDAGNGEMIHILKCASSSDGVSWSKQGVVVKPVIGFAQAFSRPTVLRRSNGYHMWFSYRSGNGTSYRIGYAYSADGSCWTLDNANSGIEVSAEGWDSEMIEYPFVFEHKGSAYMLYNGNGFGKTGFGLATLIC